MARTINDFVKEVEGALAVGARSVEIRADMPEYCRPKGYGASADDTYDTWKITFRASADTFWGQGFTSFEDEIGAESKNESHPGLVRKLLESYRPLFDDKKITTKILSDQDKPNMLPYLKLETKE